MAGCTAFLGKDLTKLRETLILQGFSARDTALISVGLWTGFRISELLSLTLRDVVRDGEVVGHITVARKHIKRKRLSRTAILPDPGRRDLARWVAVLYARGQRAGCQYVFTATQQTNRPIHPSTAWRIINRAASAAGLSGRIGAHSLRKTYATMLLEQLLQTARTDTDGHLSHVNAWRGVQQALGHDSLDSTIKYIGEFPQERIDEATRHLNLAAFAECA
jgi:integrase